MFKDAEPGNKEINIERTEEALDTNASIVAAGCPFYMSWMSDSVKNKEKEDSVQVKDLAELISDAEGL